MSRPRGSPLLPALIALGIFLLMVAQGHGSTAGPDLEGGAWRGGSSKGYGSPPGDKIAAIRSAAVRTAIRHIASGPRDRDLLLLVGDSRLGAALPPARERQAMVDAAWARHGLGPGPRIGEITAPWMTALGLGAHREGIAALGPAHIVTQVEMLFPSAKHPDFWVPRRTLTWRILLVRDHVTRARALGLDPDHYARARNLWEDVRFSVSEPHIEAALDLFAAVRAGGGRAWLVDVPHHPLVGDLAEPGYFEQQRRAVDERVLDRVDGRVEPLPDFEPAWFTQDPLHVGPDAHDVFLPAVLDAVAARMAR